MKTSPINVEQLVATVNAPFASLQAETKKTATERTMRIFTGIGFAAGAVGAFAVTLASLKKN